MLSHSAVRVSSAPSPRGRRSGIAVRSYGGPGLSHLVAGPSPRALSPWHDTQPSAENAALPRPTASSLAAGGAGAAVPVFAIFAAGANPTTVATTAAICGSVRIPPNPGIAVPGAPSRTVVARSSTVGPSPAPAVERHL